jgi:hypothetical protein
MARIASTEIEMIPTVDRKGLIACAQELRDNVAVAALLTAIIEANLHLEQAAQRLHSRGLSAFALIGPNTNYQSAGSFVPDALGYSISAGRLETLFMTLAITLEQLGLKIKY